jgi:hypothetical protein
VITTEGTHVSESKTKAAERLRDAERLAAAEEYAANNGEKHSSAGNGACYINNGWPSTYSRREATEETSWDAFEASQINPSKGSRIMSAIPVDQHNLVPRSLTVSVRQQDAAVAEQGAAGACAYAAAIMRKCPALTSISVTTTAISVSDPTIRWRYTWITPDECAEWLWGWDHSTDKVGYLEINPPPKLTLSRGDAQVRHMREKSPEKKLRDRKYNKELRERKAKRTPADVQADEHKAERRRRKIRGTS